MAICKHGYLLNTGAGVILFNFIRYRGETLEKKPLKIAVFIALVLALFCEVAAAAETTQAPAKEPIVVEVQIQGLKKINEGAVRRHISQQVGLPLSPEKITKDIKDIYETGYFDDVKVDVEPEEGGLKLIYIVKEKPSIVRVSFSGNKKIETDKLNEQVKISTGSVADSVLINDNLIKLKAYYEEEGFGLAQIVPVVKIDDGKAELTYLITEGPKTMIKKISFEGNHAFKAGALRKEMKSSERGMFSWVVKGGYYKKEELEADAERIRDLYFDNGYIQATVSEPEVRYAPDKKWAYITYKISEGEKFKVGAISFTGNKIFANGQLEKELKTKTGRPVSKLAIRADVMDITEKYGEKGYATASVNPELRPDIEKRTVDIAFHIEEGEVYKIGRVEISGNVKTKDYVIRREILLNEGDTFNGKLLKRSYQKIKNLNFFEDVALQPQPIPDKKQVNLLVDVKEKQTGFISIGGGYSSVDSIIGTIEFTQTNLAGTGQAIRVKGELGGRTSYGELSYKKPWFLDEPMDLTLTLYDQRRDFLDYTRNAAGFDAGVSRNFLEYWYANIDYRFENAKIYNILSTASDIVFDQAGTKNTSSISPGITRDTRDNFQDPHSGSRNSISTTLAGLGGTNDFYKVDLDSAWFFPVSENSTFEVRGRYGHAAGFDGRELPLYERYYVGGIYTVRGLGYGEGGPSDPSNGEPIGGENQIIFNTEYVFPLITDIKLKSVVFFDSGKAYDTYIGGLRYTTGFGFRWMSPMGPIRIEYGFNLHEKPGEHLGRLEFAFGSFF